MRFSESEFHTGEKCTAKDFKKAFPVPGADGTRKSFQLKRTKKFLKVFFCLLILRNIFSHRSTMSAEQLAIGSKFLLFLSVSMTMGREIKKIFSRKRTGKFFLSLANTIFAGQEKALETFGVERERRDE
jgi:hypothetical protein